jgi:hypothetical protein
MRCSTNSSYCSHLLGVCVLRKVSFRGFLEGISATEICFRSAIQYRDGYLGAEGNIPSQLSSRNLIQETHQEPRKQPLKLRSSFRFAFVNISLLMESSASHPAAHKGFCPLVLKSWFQNCLATIGSSCWLVTFYKPERPSQVLHLLRNTDAMRGVIFPIVQQLKLLVYIWLNNVQCLFRNLFLSSSNFLS